MSQEENVKKIIELAEEGIRTMADHLGVAVPHLWEVLVKQQIVEFFVDLATISIMWIGFVVGVKMWFNLRSWLLANNDGEARDIVPVVMGAVLGGFLIFTLIGTFETIQEIGQLINPEYYALKDIAELIKQRPQQ